MIRVATAILFALALHQPVHADLRNSNSCDVPAEHIRRSQKPGFADLTFRNWRAKPIAPAMIVKRSCAGSQSIFQSGIAMERRY